MLFTNLASDTELLSLASINTPEEFRGCKERGAFSLPTDTCSQVKVSTRDVNEFRIKEMILGTVIDLSMIYCRTESPSELPHTKKRLLVSEEKLKILTVVQ